MAAQINRPASLSRLLNSNTAGGRRAADGLRPIVLGRPVIRTTCEKVFLYRFNLNTVSGPKRSASLFVIIWAAGGETMSSFRAAQLSDQVQKVFIFGRFQLYFKMKQQLISR